MRSFLARARHLGVGTLSVTFGLGPGTGEPVGAACALLSGSVEREVAVGTVERGALEGAVGEREASGSVQEHAAAGSAEAFTAEGSVGRMTTR